MPKNNDKLKELLEQAEQGTKAVFESENYRNYLATMSKFHSYSFRNSLLILIHLTRAKIVRVTQLYRFHKKWRIGTAKGI